MPGFQSLKTLFQDKTVPLCILAIFFISISAAILNSEVYARMAPYFGVGREISTLLNGAMFLVIALVAMKKPSFLDLRQISFVVIPLLILSAFLLALALEIQNPALVLLALFCRSIGNAWGITVFSVALTTIASGRTVLVTIGLGIVASGLFGYFLPVGMPLLVACLLLMLCSAMPIVLTAKISAPQFQTIRQSATAKSLGVSDLSEFRSLRNLFFCVLLVRIASGYALAFNEQFNAPIGTIVENVILGIIVFVVLVGDKEKVQEKREASEGSGAEGRENQLFSFVALLILAGFLVAPFSFGHDTTITNTLLRLGRDCFDMLIWLVIASFGRRNIFMLLPILGTVRFVSAIGTDLGAMAGHATNGLIADDPTIAMAFTAVFAFVFVAFLWLGFRNFNFTDVIKGVKEVTPPEINLIGDHIAQRCQILGESNSLTERETEILCLLAKGRDGKFIAEEYVLSYNTVKTHIKHLYQKLGVHSRQEIIDLVGEVDRHEKSFA